MSRRPPVIRAGSDSKPNYYTPNKLGVVGVKELSSLFGVSNMAVTHWRTRDALPRPDSTVSGVPVWTITTMIVWALQTGRRILLCESDIDRYLPTEITRV